MLLDSHKVFRRKLVSKPARLERIANARGESDYTDVLSFKLIPFCVRG
jgi:hypothetical protein